MTPSQLAEKACTKLGIKALTPMQKAMSKISFPTRTVLLAPTGSGKTLAFAIPFIASLPKDAEGVKGVVMVPTRELALQVGEVLRSIAAPEFKTAVFYGGHSMETEKNALSGQPDIIVATPGRLLDHLQRGNLSLFGVQSLVLDEYDKSLELGFLQEIGSIVGRMRNVRNIILTSATKLTEIPDFLGAGPFKILDYTAQDEAKPEILFRKVESPSADKLDTLVALLRDYAGKKVIVFVNHRDAADRVYKHLKALRFPVGLYHGGLEQDDREKALLLFANGSTPVLVSTDLAARGLDITGVDAVVHYHLPLSPEAMTHRNGRTARMGAQGEAFAIVSDSDKLPDFFPALDNYWPEGKNEPQAAEWATLFINAGKRDKISRGDIAGFLIHKGGLKPDEVGKIDVKDKYSFVAVPASKARVTATNLAPHKLKNTKVRVTQLKG